MRVSRMLISITVPVRSMTSIWSPERNGCRNSSKMPDSVFSRMSWKAKLIARENTPSPARTSTGFTDGKVTATASNTTAASTSQPAVMTTSATQKRGAAASVVSHNDWALSLISSPASGVGVVPGRITTNC